MDDFLILEWQMSNVRDWMRLRELRPVATFIACLPFLFVLVLQVIRWVNWHPELRTIRILWLALWCCGAAWLASGVILLRMVVP